MKRLLPIIALGLWPFMASALELPGIYAVQEQDSGYTCQPPTWSVKQEFLRTWRADRARLLSILLNNPKSYRDFIDRVFASRSKEWLWVETLCPDTWRSIKEAYGFEVQGWRHLAGAMKPENYFEQAFLEWERAIRVIVAGEQWEGR